MHGQLAGPTCSTLSHVGPTLSHVGRKAGPTVFRNCRGAWGNRRNGLSGAGDPSRGCDACGPWPVCRRRMLLLQRPEDTVCGVLLLLADCRPALRARHRQGWHLREDRARPCPVLNRQYCAERAMRNEHARGLRPRQRRWSYSGRTQRDSAPKPSASPPDHPPLRPTCRISEGLAFESLLQQLCTP